MGLKKYRQMRKLDETPEPGGGKRKPKVQPIFVVQLHHATRRHYDFRLQVGDVLKSWAVPKGPSYDPQVKRLAVEVEDHPLDYASFEGDIPEGHYGAGHVDIFDSGTWSTEGSAAAQLAKGELRFELFGKRLRGGWHLVRTRRGKRQPEWLLFKSADRHAGTLEADQMLEQPPARSQTAPKRTRRRKAEPRKASPARSHKVRARSAVKVAPDLAALEGVTREQIEDAAFAPQLAQVAVAPPQGEGWAHELKWDGYRLLATVVDGQVRLWSRNALEWTERVPAIAAAVGKLQLRQARLDGELIALFEERSDFNLLQAALAGEADQPLAYVLFDLPHLDGYSLADVPLLERKSILEHLLRRPPVGLRYSEHHVGDGAEAFALAEENGLEGIVSKKIDGVYRPRRTGDWLKIRTAQSDEFAVVGFTAPRGSRTGLGSLLLARATEGGGWGYVGRVGSGLSMQQLQHLARELIGRARDQPLATLEHVRSVDVRRVQWVTPSHVAEVYYRGYGKDGLLRQPSLKGIREDKTVAELQGKQARALPETQPRATSGRKRGAADQRSRGGTPSSARETAGAAKSAPARRRTSALEPPKALTLTSPDRVVFPQAGLRKRDVFAYYGEVAPYLLADMGGRPLSIVRCPDGIAGTCFFQKHRTGALGANVRGVKIREESGKLAEYIYVDDAAGLLELVQMNVLEFHPWGSRVEAPDVADRLIFDLDPDPAVSWTRIKAAARLLKDRLEQIGLASFLRASGGKGLHVVVPLNPGASWDEAKHFCQSFAATLAEAMPDEFVAVASKERRKGKIFIDYLRNSRGATSVASYSLRARPSAAVAVPLAWSELARLPGPDAFDIAKTLRRIKRVTSDPWAGAARLRQRIDGK